MSKRKKYLKKYGMHISNPNFAEITSSLLFKTEIPRYFPASLSNRQTLFPLAFKSLSLNLNSKTSMRVNSATDENSRTGFSAYQKVVFLFTLLSMVLHHHHHPPKKRKKTPKCPECVLLLALKPCRIS